MPRAVLVGLVLAALTAGRAHAADPPAGGAPLPKPLATLRADTDGDGQRDEVSIGADGTLRVVATRAPAGEVVLGVDGWRIVSAKLAFRDYGSGHRVLLATLADVDGAESAVLVEQTAAGRLDVLWRGAIGAQDRDAEWGVGVELGDPWPLYWETRPEAFRCDGAPARLHRRGWDWKGRQFRPVSPSGALPAPAGAVSLTAKRGAAPAGLDATTRPQVFRVAGASSAWGDGGSAANLSVPGEIDDGKLDTAWIETRPGHGRGEFVSFRARAKAYPVVALRVVPGDAASAAALGKRHRPRRLHVVTDAGAAFVVELDGDPAAGAPGEAYWVVLPQPVATRCVTVVIDEVWSAKGASGGGETAIAELSVLTDLDGGGAAALELLAETVATGSAGDAQAAEDLLMARGPAAAVALLAMLDKPGRTAPARRRLVLALARLGDPSGADAVAGAWKVAGSLHASGGAADAREDSDMRHFRDGLQKMGTGAIPALAALMLDDDAAVEVRAGAATLLGLRPEKEAHAALDATCGRGPRPLRQAATRALGERDVGELPAALAAAATGGDPAAAMREPCEADRWRVVALLAARVDGPQTAVAEAAAARLSFAKHYELRHRLIEVLAATIDVEAARTALAEALEREPEPALRALAAARLGRHAARSPDFARERLVATLADADPGVRGAAVAGLGAFPDAVDADGALAARLGREAWPELRRALALALGDRCDRAGPADALYAAVAGDASIDVRRAALSGLVRCKHPKAGATLLAIVADRRAGAGYRRFAAQQLGVLGDRAVVPRALALFSAARKDAFDDEGDLWVAAALAESLGRLGDPRAAAALADAAEDPSFWPIQAAAIDALGRTCAAEGRRPVRAALRAPDGKVVGAARRAVKACGW